MLSRFVLFFRYNQLSANPLRNLCTKMGEKVKVQVKQGTIVGQRKRFNGLEFNNFLGVPYALPPLGKLRFRSPEPIEYYNDAELDCTKHRAVSHQRDAFTQEVVGSEDCLYLNIYVPQQQSQQSLPVMVWIHGGGFWFGSGDSDYYYPMSLLEENVIVVTLNYRLGALGFLYLPEEGIWGNAGLKDQRLALQWIHENIECFNGDPSNVCLFGESAGAAAIHLHSYASHSNKLFHKAIMQSGTGNMEWVFQQNAAYKTRRLAELLGCSSAHSSGEMINFLQSESVKPIDILANTLKVLTPDERRRGLPLTFKPVVEDSSSPDSFINVPILKALEQQNSLNIPIIMGYNSAEGLAMVFNAVRKLPQCDEDLARFVPRNLPLPIDGVEVQELANKMRDFYLNGQKLTPKLLDGLADLLSDYHFTVDMQRVAELQVRCQPNAPLYFYKFDYVGGRNFYKRFLQLEHLNGACHGDELFYLFQMAADSAQLTPADADITKKMCKLFVNFARYNNPCQTDVKDVDTWTPVDKPKSNNDTFILNYLTIGNNCKMGTNPDKERIEFWRDIYRTHTPIDYSQTIPKGKL